MVFRYKNLWFLLIMVSQTALTDVITVENLTITASRKAETSDNLSVTSIDHVGDVKALHISEILVQSPGTWISRGNGQEHLTAIRSPVLTGAGGCGPFLMTEDNVSLRAPAFCNANQLFDVNFEQVDTIEVLRGPGTAFHGSNAMHGVINIISPSFVNKRYTAVGLEYEDSHEFYRLSVDHRDENWLLQWNGAKDNGYKDKSGYDQQKIRFKYRNQGDSWSLTHNLNMAYLDQQTAGYVKGKNAYKNKAMKKQNNDTGAFRRASSLRYQTEWALDLNERMHLLITPYIRANKMEFLMHFAPGTPVEENGHHSAGFISAHYFAITDYFTLVSGLDFDYTDGYLKETQKETHPSPKFPQGKHYDYDVDVTTTAAFLQGEFSFGDVALTLGNRWEYARYDYTNNLTAGSACPGIAVGTGCRYTRPADAKQAFYNWSPKVSLNWNYINNEVIYLTLAKAYRAPQTAELYRLEEAQNITNITSEEIESIEIGFKGYLFDRVNYQLSAYQMYKDNVIFKDKTRANIDGQKTKHKGAELSLTVRIIDQLLFSAQMSYAKHQYDSNFEAGIKNKIIDTAPRHIHSAMLSYLPVQVARFDLEWVYMGKYYLDPENNFSYKGHQLLNLRYKHELPQRWTLSFGVQNILNTDYADRADMTAAGTIQERYFVGEPRSVKIGISKVF